MDLETYNREKKLLDELRRQSDRAAGQVEQLLKQLKQEHGCDNVDAAKKLHVDMVTECEAAIKQRDKLVEKFELDFGEKLT